MADLRAHARRGRLDPRDAAAREVIALLTASTVFACPSVYEPLGIVNLEAMACELPVVATAPAASRGRRARRDRLARADRAGPGRHRHARRPGEVRRDLAAALTDAVSDPSGLAPWASPDARRAVDSFSWASIGDLG
jgi:starch synthase